MLLLQQNEWMIYNIKIIIMTLLILNNKLEEVICHKYFKDKQAQRVLKESTVSFKKIFSKLILFKEFIYVAEY